MGTLHAGCAGRSLSRIARDVPLSDRNSGDSDPVGDGWHGHVRAAVGALRVQGCVRACRGGAGLGVCACAAGGVGR